MSLAQALADELGLDISEAKDLVDAEVLADKSDDGLVYRYVYDFSLYVSPTVAKKLMAKYRRLQVEVPSWFFDRVSRTEYIYNCHVCSPCLFDGLRTAETSIAGKRQKSGVLG